MPKRIIPCLDIKGGRVVKGIQFANIQDAGDPVEIAKAYDEAGADELVLLDIAASAQERNITLDLFARIVEQVSIPLIVGGGIRELKDFQDLLNVGVSKISINSSALKTPELISEAATKFGEQCIVVAIDAKRTSQGNWTVYSNGGNINTHRDVIEWAMEVKRLGAGEILLTSMDADGTKNGYDIELTKAITDKIKIPVIASGGAGKLEHFLDIIVKGGADAVLAASLFHYKELEIRTLKEYLNQHGISVN